MEAFDAGAILSIQSECPEIAQWSESDYDFSGKPGFAGWVADKNHAVAGFLVCRRVASDIEILNFAVRGDSRRQGAGALLLQTALDWGRGIRAEKAFLEVRESNSTALRFYERHGFRITGRRSRYYSSPSEDALLLETSFSE
jgi:ribosomal-protein-alanine N-acetyltransferase